MKNLLRFLFVGLLLAACSTEEPVDPEDPSKPTPPPTPSKPLYSQVESEAVAAIADDKGNVMIDFSRVGYMWGDKEIPNVPVVKTISAPAANADATELIQDAIDEVAKLPLEQRGAILLNVGKYVVSKTLFIRESGIVLRGVGNNIGNPTSDPTKSTVIYFTAKNDPSKTDSNINCIEFGKPTSLQLSGITRVPTITEDYVPMGRFYVEVSNPESFAVNDEVCLYYHTNQKWIEDLKMDEIKGCTADEQWQATEYQHKAERVITKIEGNKLHFDNPVVMEIDKKYGGGSVYKKTFDRIQNSGVESIWFDSYYYTSGTKPNENAKHGWMAIKVLAAEHCWFKRVAGRYFGYALVFASDKAKNITVENCWHSEMKSPTSGGYKYTFANGGQLNLYKDCTAFDGRHNLNASPRAMGPNVYHGCKVERGLGQDGPHHRWNSGTLYDAITSDNCIATQDRGSSGSGHGWTSVNNFFWNCGYRSYILQSPWVSGKNYAIGCTGGDITDGYAYHKDRPHGEWISKGTNVSPMSLYDAQLELRKQIQPGGVFDVD